MSMYTDKQAKKEYKGRG